MSGMRAVVSWFIPLTAVVLVAVTSCGQASSGQAAAQASPLPSRALVVVNGDVNFQTIAGFGISEAFGQAETVKDASPAASKKVLDDLFSDTSGAGLTILRNEISADPGSTIEPTAPASPAATPAYVPLSAASDDQGQLWLAQTIKADYGVTDVFADAWSAPPFMKVNNSVDHGGALCGVPSAKCASGNWVQAYADYLKQYAADYAAAGVPLSYIGPVNEPDYAPASYDGMTLTPAQAVSVLDVLEKTMAASKLPTKVECCAAYGWSDAENYAEAIQNDPLASADTAFLTSHGYAAPVVGLLSSWAGPTWETEWSTFQAWDPTWDDGTSASGFAWAQNIFNGLDTSNLSAFLYWWGSSTPQTNGDNESLVQLDGDTVLPSARLWAFANFSRFVRPGAVRVAVVTADDDLTVDAFKNTDKTAAVVALNSSATPVTTTFTLKDLGLHASATVTPYLTNGKNAVTAQAKLHASGGTFPATVPPRSLVTYQVTP